MADNKNWWDADKTVGDVSQSLAVADHSNWWDDDKTVGEEVMQQEADTDSWLMKQLRPIPGFGKTQRPPAAKELDRQASDRHETQRIGEARKLLSESSYPTFSIQAGADILSLLARPFNGQVADELNRANDAVEQVAAEQEQGGVVPDILQRGARGVGRSVTSMLAGSAIGGPVGAIGLAAAQEGNQAITEGRDMGLEGEELARYATSQAAIEGSIAGAFSAVGLGGAEKAISEIGKQAVKQGIKQAAWGFTKSLAQELPEELLTEAAHLAATQMAQVDESVMTPEALKRMAQDTFVQTVMTMGLIEGIQRSGDLLERKQIGTSPNSAQGAAGNPPPASQQPAVQPTVPPPTEPTQQPQQEPQQPLVIQPQERDALGVGEVYRKNFGSNGDRFFVRGAGAFDEDPMFRSVEAAQEHVESNYRKPSAPATNLEPGQEVRIGQTDRTGIVRSVNGDTAILTVDGQDGEYFTEGLTPTGQTAAEPSAEESGKVKGFGFRRFKIKRPESQVPATTQPENTLPETGTQTETTVRGETQQDDPINDESEDPEFERELDETFSSDPQGIPSYVISGMQRSPADIRSQSNTGRPIGIAVGPNRVSDKVIELAGRHANRGGQVFVDSGMFGTVTKGEPGQKPNYHQVFDQYDRVIENTEPANRRNLMFVMPDYLFKGEDGKIVGGQQETLDLQREFRNQAQDVMDRGAKIIIPLQRGFDDDAMRLGEIASLASDNIDLSSGNFAWVFLTTRRLGLTLRS